MNYRTIISFGEKNIDFLMENYDKLLCETKRLDIKSAHIRGVTTGYT
jgi:hypothetical protein